MAITPDTGPSLPPATASEAFGDRRKTSKRITTKALGVVAAIGATTAILVPTTNFLASELERAVPSKDVAGQSDKKTTPKTLDPERANQVASGFVEQIIDIAPLAERRNLGDISNGASAGIHLYDKSGKINLTLYGQPDSENGPLTTANTKAFSVTKTNSNNENTILLKGNHDNGQWQVSGSVETAAIAVGEIRQQLAGN